MSVLLVIPLGQRVDMMLLVAEVALGETNVVTDETGDPPATIFFAPQIALLLFVPVIVDFA